MFQVLAEQLSNTALSQQLAGIAWFVPAIQTIHILAIAAVFTTLTMLNARLVKLTSRGPEPAQMSRDFGPFIWGAFLVLLVTGALLVVVEPARELLSTTFWLKMTLVLLLLVVTWTIQRLLRRTGTGSAMPVAHSRWAGCMGVASLMLCLAIIAAGRLIAYV